ncbi:MAG: hypothetical protein EG825_17570, partial [Rhodocyclaceae bacterium]|nr:hypothetical protein [Rhodocyclaceae bacterium]
MKYPKFEIGSLRADCRNNQERAEEFRNDDVLSCSRRSCVAHREFCPQGVDSPFRRLAHSPILLALALLSSLHSQSSNCLAAELGTAFTYQGKLGDGGAAANGLYDFEFTVYDAATGGNHVAPALPMDSVSVTNGLFTAMLDFGPGVFLGEERWLGISVRTNRAADFATFPTRQLLSPVPYALHASQAGIAASVTGNSVSAQGLNTLAPPAPGQVLTFDSTGLAWTNPAALGNAWSLGGNGGTTPNVNFLGTTDNQPLEFKVNGRRALRLEPTATGAPNVIAGDASNVVAPGTAGGTVAG